MSEKQPVKADHRSKPTSEAFRAFMASGWADPTIREPHPDGPTAAAGFAARRREQLSAAFPGERLVIPAGGLKVRSNDTDYAFRPHSAFAWLTGLGADRDPDAVLVLDPRTGDDGTPQGHEATLYLRPTAPRDTEEFFSDARYGEFWVGSRPGLAAVSTELGLPTAHVEGLEAALTKDAGQVALRVVADADQGVTQLVQHVRSTTVDAADAAAQEQLTQSAAEADSELARHLSTARLVKDEYEQDQMRLACRQTADAFEEVVRQLPEAVRRGRGERWVEGTFGLYARHGGNGVGYDSICAAGDHATTLHWVRNTGDLREDELLLLDAGVEVDSLYTADVTRTLPISGRFTPDQREVYDAVYDAQQAGVAACRPGNTFKDVHSAAIRVIAERVHAWGLLPEGVDVETTLDADKGQYHRRWMVHGTSHHLGLDVHDCAAARKEDYQDGVLRPGMIITVEPGLYFKADDELAPERFRGIGVRIEDDVLITEHGCEVLTDQLPRSSADVESWMDGLLGRN